MKTTIAILCFSLSIGAVSAAEKKSPPQFLFDDFSYTSVDDLAKSGWIVRTEQGWPGVPGSTWGKERMSLHDDPAKKANRVLRMTSETNGTTTKQSQLCHARKYLEGTYAARVRFTDGPVSGPDGDQIVETFYLISPQKAPMDPDYSEIDFEYLPNGGWGHTAPTIHATTWETFQLEPWIADNKTDNRAGSAEGWHTLVTQVGDGMVRYFLDGKPFASHGGKFYPEVPMSINFNLWFVKEGVSKSSENRQYIEDIDWVFHQTGKPLSPTQVVARVADLRKQKVKFKDTVPAKVPALASPCNF